MGADGAFDRRRKELAVIAGRREEEVTDDEVLTPRPLLPSPSPHAPTHPRSHPPTLAPTHPPPAHTTDEQVLSAPLPRPLTPIVPPSTVHAPLPSADEWAFPAHPPLLSFFLHSPRFFLPPSRDG